MSARCIGLSKRGEHVAEWPEFVTALRAFPGRDDVHSIVRERDGATLATRTPTRTRGEGPPAAFKPRKRKKGEAPA